MSPSVLPSHPARPSHRRLHPRAASLLVALGWLGLLPAGAPAQDESVNPGVNQSFENNPEAGAFVERFEREGREVYDRRADIVKALSLKPGMTVADVGAGTGLFTRLIAKELEGSGKVIAVDIAENFVNHTVKTAREAGLTQVEGLVCTADDAKLPENSVDLVFICDTYHHFEFPLRTMTSIRRALKPGGRVVVIDFERIEGTSSDWILGHVRAGKDVFRGEIEDCGLVLEKEEPLFKENYFLSFRIAEDAKGGS